MRQTEEGDELEAEIRRYQQKTAQLREKVRDKARELLVCPTLSMINRQA